MNERIQQLAHEAGLPTYNPEGIPTKLEKFAELIVKECLEMMGNNISGTFDSDWDFDTQVKYVKKHFGVEE